MQQTYIQHHFQRWLSFYFLCNLLLSLAISTRYYYVQGVPETFAGAAFALLHSIGHMGLLLLIASTPLILLSIVKQALFAKRILVVLYATFGITLLLADTFIYQQYRFHINIMVVELFLVGGTEVISFPVSMWIKIIATITGILILQLSFLYLADLLAQRAKPMTKFVTATVLVNLLIANVIHIWADGLFIRDVTQQTKLLPLAYPATAKKLMANYNLLDVEAYKQQAMLKMRSQKGDLSYPSQLNANTVMKNKPNVLWIIIDAWRTDTLTARNMPNTYAFSQKSMQYINHFSGSNNTRHGMFSLFYSLPGSYWESILQNNTSPFIYQAFAKNDYQMQVFASAKLTMPEFDQTLFSSIDSLRTHSKGATPWQRDVDAVDSFIDAYQTALPSFNVLFLDAAHGFSHPENYEKVFQPSLQEPNYMALNASYERTPFFNLYRNALHFVDSQLARIFKTIEQDLGNTIVIITGDHSEEFNDSKQGFWGHNSNFSRFQTQVPMIVHWPNRQPAIINRQTSHVDIVPTFLNELFALEDRIEDVSIGHSLFDENPQRESIILGRKGYYAINDNRYLYELDRLGNFTIYNQQYEEQEHVAPNVPEIQQALDQMSRFYR